jgi:hypothetical protein
MVERNSPVSDSTCLRRRMASALRFRLAVFVPWSRFWDDPGITWLIEDGTRADVTAIAVLLASERAFGLRGLARQIALRQPAETPNMFINRVNQLGVTVERRMPFNVRHLTRDPAQQRADYVLIGGFCAVAGDRMNIPEPARTIRRSVSPTEAIEMSRSQSPDGPRPMMGYLMG